jgi:hypothetical protein
MENNIQFLGLDDFEETEKTKMQLLAERHYEKFSRDLQGKLIIHAKKHKKEGNRHMYSFHARVQKPSNLINVEGSDWELEKALHKVLVKVENRIQDKFKTKGK